MKRIQDAHAACAVPDFGPMVRRERLLKAVSVMNHDLLVLAAPSGYGKSVLAAQIATELFDDAVWVAVRGSVSRPVDLLAIVARRLGAQVPDAPTGGLLSIEQNPTQLCEAIGETTRVREGARLCVVLDDAQGASSGAWDDLAAALRRRAPGRAMLLVTTRDADAAHGSRSRCVLDLADLCLNSGETAAVAGSHAVQKLSKGEVELLKEMSGGHAALVAVLSRHGLTGTAASGSGSGAGRCGDLQGLLLESAATQLAEAERSLLYAAALLGNGDVEMLRRLALSADPETLRRVSERMPLFLIAQGDGGRPAFRLHDLAREAFASKGFAGSLEDADAIVRTILLEAVDAGRDDVALEVATKWCTSDLLADWLEQHGMRLLTAGSMSAVAIALQRLGPQHLARPRLMLLGACMAKEHDRSAEARSQAEMACRLAEAEGDHEALVGALVLAARASLTLGDLDGAAGALRRLLDCGEEALDLDSLVLARAGAGVTAMLRGDVVSATAHQEAARLLAGRPGVSPEARARALNYEGYGFIASSGRTADALRVVDEALRLGPLSAITCAYLLGNRCGVLVQLGRIRRARAALGDFEAHLRRYQLPEIGGFVMLTAMLSGADGDDHSSARWAELAVQRCHAEGDTQTLPQDLGYSACLALTRADAEGALSDAESALECAAGLHIPAFEHFATVQIRAALLALGDPVAAAHVAASRAWAVEHQAAHVALLADCVLAEIDRLDGRPSDGIARLRGHSDYVLTESANWLSAMYVRAFPGLLGMLASAVGADKIPTHLFRMVLPGHAAVAMPMARETMTPEAWRTLARRMGYSAKKDEGARGAGTRTGAGDCQVRFFGGLQVTTSDGPIPDRVWRKRKARALFAMLVAARGKDVPREVLLEALWPGMDEERARNNLYVTWAAMKNALAPTAPKGGSCPYVETFAGVCRALPGVTSDIDEFDEAVVRARKAEQAGDADAVLVAYDRIAEIYRGDLMSGDLYDDWCSQLRDRYRHEFGDAMLAAARLRASRGEPERALQTVRMALVHDAWREDFYQAALAYQIECGQRSAAIETYMACRTRLAEDLGLDPSVETRRLYDQILAMEGSPGDETGA